MVFDVKFHQIGNGVLYFLYPGITKLNHLPTFLADQVIMLSALICLFKLGDVFTKLMFDHQIAFLEQFNGIVKCGAADPVILIFHGNVQSFYIEMIVT